jgi:cytochrome oxidase Cu insertion factor (SCO1/SenC/PrrC family)
MTESKTDVLLLMLMGTVILLMAAIVGLFLRMNQLQGAILEVLAMPQTTASRERGLKPGTMAPDFTLTDTDGETVSLGAFAAKKVLLAFSSLHCPACKEMYPHLKAFSENQKNVQVLMVSQGSVK